MEKIQFIQTTPEELNKEIIDCIKKELEEFKQNYKPKVSEEFLTRKEVSKFLKVDLSTIHNYTKKGFLISYQIGGKIYYKKSEVINSIEKVNC